MRIILLLLTSIVFCVPVFSQTIGAKISRTIGGTFNDIGYDVQQTSDGGFLFAGVTESNDKDVSGHHADSLDLWVVKLNHLGIIEWQKCLGGTAEESFGKLICNADGTAIVMGTTSSGNGDNFGYKGNEDVWVIKLDASGNILWQKSLGGSWVDGFVFADKTNDNGFIIAASTGSNDGDVSGFHGYSDAWVVKLNSNGDIEWQKALGGSSIDKPASIMQDSDGNYIMVGTSYSSDGDAVGNHGTPGSSDVWVVKLSSTGNIVWSKMYGGNDFESGTKAVVSNDGSITVLGLTSHIVSGGSGGPSITQDDNWVINIDINGNLIWQKNIGGSSTEVPVNICKDADGMYLIASYTRSKDGDASTNHGSVDVLLTRLTNSGNIIWTKCFGGPSEEILRDIYNDVTGNNYVFLATASRNGGDVIGYHQKPNPSDSSYDAWVVKVNYDGNVEWQRCLGGYSRDLLYSIRKMPDNQYVLAGESRSNDGDVRLNRGNQDAWVVELGPINTIKGTVFVDNNLNGTMDVGEPLYSNVVVRSKSISDSAISIPYGGLFTNEVDTGTYVTTVTPNLPYYNVVPSSASSSFSTYFNKDSISFALQPIANKQDLVVNLIPVTAARPGFTSPYRIFYRNVGTTTIASGEILFKKDSRTSLVSSLPSVSSTSGDTLKWTYNNFAPGDTASILINLQVATPPTVNVGDTLAYMAIITPVAGDETPANDTAILKQRTVGAIDPNDKTENNGGLITSSFITDGSYLQYTVRFQNTGTADAINVIVRDTLGNRVDLNTLEIVTASHPYSLSIENGNELTWTFNNIMLPASSADEPASHGYIVYRIKPKSDVVVGETIHNTASIYFDYNLPVLTNDAITLVQDNFSALPVKLLNFTGQLTNNTVQLNWQTANETNFEKFEIERSFDGAAFNRIGSVAFANTNHNYKATDNVSALTSKHIFYRLKLVDADGKFSYSKVIAFNINSDQNRFTVYPNPANTEIFVSITAGQKSNLQIKIIDAGGRIVSEEQKTIEKGNNVFPVNTSKLGKGNYLLQIVSGEETKTSKFIIMN